MENIKRLLKENPIKLAEQAKQKFLEKGFIWNENYGWEKPEVLERFGLDPNMTGIPTQLANDYDMAERKVYVKDSFGKKTGEVKIEQYRVENPDKKVIVVSQRWVDYQNYKHQQNLQQVAENYNTPPIEAYVDN